MKLSRQKYLESHIPKNLLDCFSELESEVELGHFTAWSVANNRYQLSCYWADEYAPFLKCSKKDVENFLHPVFDLASLTKPIFINLYLRALFGNKFHFKMNEPISQLLKNDKCSVVNFDLYQFFNEKSNFKYTLNSFLSHTSGAKNWFWMGSSLWLQKATSHHSDPNIFYSILDSKDYFFKDCVQKNINRKSINNIILPFGEGLYSDINYYLLARLIECIEFTDGNWKKRLHFLNEYLNTEFMHSSIDASYIDKCIPFYPYISSYNTEVGVQQFKHCHYGFVHDSNANILSSFGDSSSIVSGHSGLFGNVCDVENALRKLSQTQRDLFTNKEDKKRFCYGLDTPESQETSAGIKNWPIQSGDVCGHLGYTGTSFWFYNEPEKLETKNFHILLTNRTAQRKKMGVDKCPRMLVLTDKENKSTHCFQIYENSVRKISLNEGQETLLEFSGYSKKIWESSVLRDLPNMLAIRQFIAQKLWNI